MKGKIIVITCALVMMACSYKNPDNGPIRLNQVGYSPMQEMTATIVMDEPVKEVFILNEKGDTVWIGVPAVTLPNPISGKTCQIVDFSALDTPGTYTLYAKTQLSTVNCQFSIKEHEG